MKMHLYRRGQVTVGALFVSAVVGVAHAAGPGPALPADTYLYTDYTTAPYVYDDPSYVELNPGNWGDATPPSYYDEGRPGRHTLANDAARWTLGQTPGEYTVQIHWAVSSGFHANDAQYDLTDAGGTQTYHINQRQRAN